MECSFESSYVVYGFVAVASIVVIVVIVVEVLCDYRCDALAL